MDQIDIFLIAGEASGDDRGAELATALLEKNPHLRLAGVAGPKMRAAGVFPLFQMEQLQVMGFIDVLAALPRLIPLFHQIEKAIWKTHPHTVITIDYPGMNLRLMRALARKNHPARRVHYVCPSVWAWGKKRIPLMASCLDELLTLFPFEPPLFAHTSLSVTCVGHPLARQIEPRPTPSIPLVALFPGSRIKEVKRNLPIQIASVPPGYAAIISCAAPFLEPLIRSIAPEAAISYCARELMQNAKFAIAKSGTITLELALHAVPTVVTYAVTPLDRFIARYLFKINLPFYALPNILLNKALFPECFGPQFTKKTVKEKFAEIEHNEQIIREGCLALHQLLAIPSRLTDRIDISSSQ